MDTLMDAIDAQPTLSRFYWMLRGTGLGDKLEGPRNFTVFAPDNSAFDRLPAEDRRALIEDYVILVTVLENHITRDLLLTQDLAHRITVETLHRSALSVQHEGSLHVGGARLICADIPTGNGVLHVVARLATPE